MPWAPYRLRDADIWAFVDDKGKLVADASGRVDVIYKPNASAKIYRAAARNLTPLPGNAVADFPAAATKPAGEPAASSGAPGSEVRTSETHAARTQDHSGVVAVQVWTDGACTGNPGPAGIGVVLVDGGHRQELSEYLGNGTNNIAELTAIERGLQLVTDRERPVEVYSDSAYAIGLLSKGWKAKANVELVARIRSLLAEFARVRFVKVAGHSGIPLNERTDELATASIRNRAIRRD